MSSSATTAALVDAASAPYRATDLFAYYRARGKLRGDPAFTGILREGLLVGSERILDLGCGQGLLAAWMSAGTPFANIMLIARPGKKACQRRALTDSLIAQ
jgi:hypothetical protein